MPAIPAQYSNSHFERFLGKFFNRAERKHLVSFQEQSKAINDKVRFYALIGQVLIEAKQNAADPFCEIEKLMTWEAFKSRFVFWFARLVTKRFPRLPRQSRPGSMELCSRSANQQTG
jgi:hypothetical protein